MCLAHSLPSSWLILDIELQLNQATIRELALIGTGEEPRIPNPEREQLNWVIDRIEQARVIVGHNLRRHDIPHLYRLAGRELLPNLDEKICDTLELSSLFFVGKATHSLNKLYQEEKGLSDPVEDARESYEVYQRCQRQNNLPILVRYWATCLLPDSYLSSIDNNHWGLIEPYDTAINSSKWTTLQVRNTWLNVQALQEYLETLARKGKNINNLGAIVFLHWLYYINSPAACRPKWLELELSTFRDAEEQATYSLNIETLTSELQHFFGQNYGFREGQLEIIQMLLEAQRVPLGILPTGGGKSLTFQLPALILSRRYRALSIIVSPLQALMEDQVISLKIKLEEQGLNDYVSRVAFLTGSQTFIEQKTVIEDIHNGRIDILYLSPERLRQPRIKKLLQRRSPYLWVLDEAHTLSQWGYDFRPDFLKIVKAIQDTNRGQQTIRLGFVTATATLKVIEDLTSSINSLNNSLSLQRVPNGDLFRWRPEINTHIENIEIPSSFSPKNTTEVRDTARFRRVVSILNECRQQGRIGSIEDENNLGSVAIIYTPTRKMAEIYAEALRENHYQAEAFHSRIRSSDKRDILQKFKKGNLEVVVATNAFGMGIDRAGILTVIHVSPPATPEAYVQEIGRLARNSGEEGNAYLFLNEAEDFSWIFRQESKSQISSHALRRCWDVIRKKLNEGNGDTWVSGLDLVTPLGENDLDILETQTRVALYYLEKANLITQPESSPSILQITLNQHLSEDMIVCANVGTQCLIDQNKIIKYLWEIGIRRSTQNINLQIKDVALDTGLNPSQIITGIRQLVRNGVLQWSYEIAFKFASSRPTSLQEKINIFQSSVQIFLNWLEQNGEFDSDNTIPLHRPLEHELRQQEIQFSLNDALKVLEKLKLCHSRKRGYLTYFSWQGEETTLNQWLENARTVFETQWNQLLTITSNLQDIYRENQWRFSQSQLLNIADLESRLSGDRLENSHVLDILDFMQRLQLISMGRGSIGYETLYHLRRVSNSRWSDRVHQPLQEHYTQRRRRIHAMAKIITEIDSQQRIDILRDYFTLSLDDFNSRHFTEDTIQENFVPPQAYELLQGLNDNQRIIVQDDSSRALLVLAGPGSGKTHTIVRRIAYLILAKGVQPERILALAYNRAAAAELRKRLYDLLGSQGARVDALTFHVLATTLTRSRRRDAPNNLSRNQSYNWLLEQATQHIQENHPAYSYILVDEYQDIDRLKYNMITALANFNDRDEDEEQTSFLIAVGDDDQNLFEFNGANVEFIRAFRQDYRIQESIELIQNYRADSILVQFTNQFIRQVIPQEIRLRSQDIEAVSQNTGHILWGQYNHCYDAAQWIAQQIQSLNIPLKEIAILSRCWDELRFVQHIFRERRIPYQFYDNSDNLRPANSLIGQRIIERLLENPTQIIDNPQNYIEEIRQNLGYSDRDVAWPSIAYSLNGYLNITREQIVNILESARTIRNNGVILSTTHSAKGSEFKYVFILEEGNSFQQTRENSYTEARRLYVGFTRAKNQLHILINRNARNHSTSTTLQVLRQLTSSENSAIQEIDITPVQRPNSIHYNWLPDVSDLYLSHRWILNGQLGITLYSQLWSDLQKRDDHLRFSHLDWNAIDTGGVVTYFSEAGCENLTRYNNCRCRIISTRGHTIFRVERDDEFYQRAGVSSDATHHYIVLPCLEIQEDLS